MVERKSGTGKALFYVTVKMVFDLTSADDGSALRVGPIYGEAMDSADKATNKAMSAAYKYAVMQAFAIPVAGQTLDGEADDETDLVPATFTAEQQAALEQLRDVAKQGLDALREAWEQQDKHTRIALAGELVALKKTADGVSNVA